MPAPLPLIQRLQRLRQPSRPDLGIASDVAALAKSARSSARQGSAASRAFLATCPDRFRGVIVDVGALRRGTLEVRVRDMSALWVIDQWLRAGGTAAIRAAEPRVKAVKLRV